MEELNIIEKISLVQNALIIAAASSAAYHPKWNNDFIVKELKEVFENKNWRGDKMFEFEFTMDDFKAMSATELMVFGFRRWDNDFNWLVPLYLINYIKPEEIGTSIMGGTVPVEEWDNDHRGGAVAYYFTKGDNLVSHVSEALTIEGD